METVVEVFQLVSVPMSNGTEKLDARLAQAVVSINAFKGVEFGPGFEAGYRKGSKSWMKFSGLKKTAILAVPTI